MTQTLKEVMIALSAISEGAHYKVEHLQNNDYIILVENDEYTLRPDNGPDPFLGINLTARTL